MSKSLKSACGFAELARESLARQSNIELQDTSFDSWDCAKQFIIYSNSSCAQLGYYYWHVFDQVHAFFFWYHFFLRGGIWRIWFQLRTNMSTNEPPDTLKPDFHIFHKHIALLDFVKHEMSRRHTRTHDMKQPWNQCKIIWHMTPN